MPPTCPAGRPATVLVASAAGQSLASSLPTQFAALSRKLGTSQRTVDLAPLPSGDPKGLSVFYLAFSWVFGGYLGAIALNAIRGNRRFLRRNALLRTAGFLINSIVGSLITVTIATLGFTPTRPGTTRRCSGWACSRCSQSAWPPAR